MPLDDLYLIVRYLSILYYKPSSQDAFDRLALLVIL